MTTPTTRPLPTCSNPTPRRYLTCQALDRVWVVDDGIHAECQDSVSRGLAWADPPTPSPCTVAQ